MSSPFVDHAVDLLKRLERVNAEERVEVLVEALQWEFEDGYSAAMADMSTGEVAL